VRLYTCVVGPNPAVVTAFLLERGQTVDTVQVDITKGETRMPAFTAINPAGTVPVLEVDGTYIAESVAICEYLDETLPGQSLLGNTALERAVTRMWLRRIDIHFVQPSSSGWRFAEGLEMCRANMYVMPEAAKDFKIVAAQSLAWIDRLMVGKRFICGERVTLADILLYVFVEFGDRAGQTIDKELGWIAGWRQRMTARPLAGAITMPAAA
jgi:glutathione S-transferase